jgi:hypothetical protein
MVADIASSSQKDSYIGYASVGALGRGLASRSENALPELDVMAEEEDTFTCTRCSHINTLIILPYTCCWITSDPALLITISVASLYIYIFEAQSRVTH